MNKWIAISTAAALAGLCTAQTSSVQEIIAELNAATPAAAPHETAAPEAPAVRRSAATPALGAEIHRGAEKSALDAVTGAWNGMILRDYTLTPDALESMGLADAETRIDVRSLFPSVDFPEGAQAVYRPVLKRVLILNTPDNIRKFESIIAALEASQNGDTDQIEIIARFVEFSEGALEELGFEWSDVTDGDPIELADDWRIQDGETLFSGALRESGTVFSQPETFGRGERRAAGDWSAIRLADQFSTGSGSLRVTGDVGPTIDVLIRALDQTAGVDVLSSPRIVTQAGEEAIIQVGQNHYFPEEFEVNGSEGTIVHIGYEDFKETLMGVELRVEPEIAKDNLIQMELTPVITELLGWRNYQVAPADSAYSYYQFRIGMSYEHDPIQARLPIFRQRQMNTHVVIQDGSTIGMGGLINEKTETFSDRVPVLGSIPLVGRLFRSEGERTVKRNLAIFLTANKIQPNGARIAQRSFE